LLVQVAELLIKVHVVPVVQDSPNGCLELVVVVLDQRPLELTLVGVNHSVEIVFTNKLGLHFNHLLACHFLGLLRGAEQLRLNHGKLLVLLVKLWTQELFFLLLVLNYNISVLVSHASSIRIICLCFAVILLSVA